jgi:hypothetical protein
MSDQPKLLGKSLSHIHCVWERVDMVRRGDRGGWQIVMEEGLPSTTLCECCGEMLRDTKVNDGEMHDTRYLVEACYESKRGNKRIGKRLYWACHDCLAMWDDGEDEPSAGDKIRADDRSGY